MPFRPDRLTEKTQEAIQQAQALAQEAQQQEITPEHLLLALLQQADFDYERVQYNTVVSAAMKVLNALADAAPATLPLSDALLRESLGILLRVLYPIAPHITHVLWGELGFTAELGELLDAPWPRPDPAALKADMIELVVQVNGKLRGSIRVPAEADRTAIESACSSNSCAETCGPSTTAIGSFQVLATV